MTDNEKFEVLLTALAELIHVKNRELSVKNYEIKSLQRTIERAEQEKTKAESK